MRLWELKLTDSESSSSSMLGRSLAFVIRSETEEAARQMAYVHSPEQWYDKGDGVLICCDGDMDHAWLDPLRSTCRELLPDGVAGVIVRDLCES